MTENEIARQVLDAAFVVHIKLGPGLFETVYEVVLAHELRKKKLLVERQRPIPIIYDGIRFDEVFRLDLLVESKVIVELKSVECLTRLHAKQLLTQLRLANVKLGLLINFGAEHLKNGIKRIITEHWRLRNPRRSRCDLSGLCVRETEKSRINSHHVRQGHNG